MANLNLSEFTEKTFVADADWTFVWDTAGLISKKVSRNNWLNSGELTTSAPVTISQTWNALAVAFTALKVNAVSTASAAGSLLLDLQVGGVSQFSVQKNGSITANNTFNLNGSIVQSAGNVIPANALILNYFNQDVVLLRDAANTLALRNGTNAQTFNVYGTYTSGTSYERLTLSAPSSANAIIGTNKGSGGGTARGLEIQTDGVTRMTIATNGVVTIPVSIAVNSAVRTGFINNLGDSLSMFAFVNDSTGTSTYAVGGSAPLMRFGGTTSSFPAIKRSSTTLQTRLADDSAFAPIQGKLTTDTAFTSGAITDTGYIVLYDSNGTAYKVACTPV